jgi:acyl-CoA thioester hydrolase
LIFIIMLSSVAQAARAHYCRICWDNGAPRRAAQIGDDARMNVAAAGGPTTTAEASSSLPTHRAEFRVLRAIPTRWMDNDHYGHVNNVAYYSYFDTAVNGWLIEASGCDVRELPAIGIVAETSCRFLRELSFPETVYAGLALEKLGNSSVVYRIGLFREQEAEPAALGRFVHVYVDSVNRRPVAVPAQIREALAAITR